VVLTSVLTGRLFAADAPCVRELRVQPAGDSTYFHVRFERPGHLYLPAIQSGNSPEVQRWLLSRLPQLVPMDRQTQAVYQRLVLPHYLPSVGFDTRTRSSVAVDGLEFVGKVHHRDKAKFVLLYVTDREPPSLDKTKDVDMRSFLPKWLQASWVEVPLELDFRTASALPCFPQAALRDPREAPVRDDLEGVWAEAQAARFAVLEALTPEFGFYGFACAATARKYRVADPALTSPDQVKGEEALHRRLYETTTGAAAITESLQLQRRLNPTYHDRGQRTIDIWTVPGIEIAEHPWEKMMAGKKPAPEPFARLVPRDNYYVHFKSFAKFLELSELLDQWGTNAIRAYEMNSRDYDLKERYERQLCLKSTQLGKRLGPALIRGMVLTGNDPYLREGSDLAVIFHVANRPLFLAAVEPFLQEARDKFSAEIRTSKVDYLGVPIESFVTPLRELSLHRAMVGDLVVYANSSTGLRRILDAQHGRLPALADSLDFQYMRTIFQLDDPQEDGFAFLSDAFIRQLVGPVSKIKEKRRLEALTSLSMITNAALFAGWETGELPADHAALLAAACLRPQDIYAPEGRQLAWDARRQVAVSDIYNTLHFTTPLIELPIDRITPAEQSEYNQFRTQYLNLWRQFFDPVGIRFSLTKPQVRVETYILPLLRDSRYETLRAYTGGGTTSFNPSLLPSQALAQWLVPFPQELRQQGQGDAIWLRLDDGPDIRKLTDLWIRRQLGTPKEYDVGDLFEGVRVALQLPLTVGVRVADRHKFVEFQDNLRGIAELLAPCTTKKLPSYKGVTITRIRFGEPKEFLAELGRLPDLYHAYIDDDWCLSLRESCLKNLIDLSVAHRESKSTAKASEAVTVNGSLYLAPAGASQARDALRFFLEWESHRRAATNFTIWDVLYRSGVLAKDAPEPARRDAALHFFGFVPVSPEGAAYVYDARLGEITNARHGSLREPVLQAGIEDRSALGQLLRVFRTLRVDFRFREDGVHTTLTMERKPSTP
jgi:hypothetical protein